MRANKTELLLSVLAVSLVLLSLADIASAGFFGLGKKKAQDEDKQKSEQVDKTSATATAQVDAAKLEQRTDTLAVVRDAASEAYAGAQAGSPKSKLDLSDDRGATQDHERPLSVDTKSNLIRRPSFFGNSAAQGRDRRRLRGQRQLEPTLGRQDDPAAEKGEEQEIDDKDAVNILANRIKSKQVLAELAAKYVSTNKGAALRGTSASARARELIEFRRGRAAEAEGGALRNKLISGSFWQKNLGKAYRVTKKGLKGGAKVIGDIPKLVEQVTDSINAFVQLDGKGKILALINEVSSDAHFVRKEFSQFSLSWSDIMERSLNFLGTNNLDKIKWKEDDDLDMRRDALHALAFGYEFMRIMIVWRENLLIAHEAFKLWLESMKVEVENKRIEVDENLIIQLRTTHSYMLLNSWMTIDEAALEARTKLDYLMEIEDDRPKNYESDYFRNIVVLQEMYGPTVEEIDNERDQVVKSIGVSGVVAENLTGVDEFFTDFRNMLAAHQIDDIDWEVPTELMKFMEMLEPQLRRSTLVYSTSFLESLGQAS